MHSSTDGTGAFGRWDDLRLVASIVDGGSLKAAGEHLGVHHSTVLRRLDAFEAALGAQLFRRSATGYRLTEVGNVVLDSARRIALELDGLDRELSTTITGLDAVVRVRVDPVVAVAIHDNWAALQRAHPGLRLEINVAAGCPAPDESVHIGLGVEKPSDTDAIAIHVMDLHSGLFASPRYIASHGVPAGLQDVGSHVFVSGAQSLSRLPFVAFVDTHVRTESVVYRTDSLVDLYHAVWAGLGIGPTTCAAQIGHGELVPVWPEHHWRTPVWMAMHTEHRHTPRIKRVWDEIRDGLRSASQATIDSQ